MLKFPGLFNNGARTYGDYLLKGEALYEVFILLVSLNLLHIADVEECLSKQLDLKHHFLRLIL
jgi:hypothetical protein